MFKTIGRRWGCRLSMGSDMTSLALRDAVIDLMPDLRCFARSLTGSVEAGDELVQVAHQLVLSRPRLRPSRWCKLGDGHQPRASGRGQRGKRRFITGGHADHGLQRQVTVL
jgi:hypothetical protein